LLDIVEFKYEITDELEILVEVSNKNKSRRVVNIQTDKEEELPYKAFFYFEDMNDRKSVYTFKKDKESSFGMNSTYLFVYNKKSIMYFDLTKELNIKNRKILKFSIDKDEDSTI
jgi:hypothetical protein